MNRFVPFFLLIGLATCKKNRTEVVPDKPVTKKVEYHIFAAKDYSAPIYANIKTDVRLQIHRINFKTGETQILWDSLFYTNI